MPVDGASVLREIDAVLARYQEVEKAHKKPFRNYKTGSEPDYLGAPAIIEGEMLASLQAAITRFAPPGYGQAVPTQASNGVRIRNLAGILQALRADYAAGRVLSLQERVRSDVFSDFLEMAEYLIEDEGLKDPAAVLAGGVLEQHSRKLHEKHVGSLPAGATINSLDDAPKKAGV